jgi:HlyD family secretion protein
MRKYLIIANLLWLCACTDPDLPSVIIKPEDANLSMLTTGELASADTILIGAPLVKHTWQYKITYLAPEGTWVKQGDRIASFDAQQQVEKLREEKNNLATEKQKLASQKLSSEQSMQQLQLDIAEAQMKLDKAEQKAKQDGDYAAQIDVKKLIIDLALAKKSFQLAKYKFDNKQQQIAIEDDIVSSEIARLSAEVQDYQQAIANMNISAPKEGIVVYVADYEGKKPAEGDSIFLAQKIIELPNLEKMIVKTTIPEQDISRVVVGQVVEIKLDAIPNKTFNGKIASLGQIVRVKSQREPSMVYDANISIDQPDIELMRPGMAARLNIIETQLNDVIGLPQTSIQYDKNETYVLVKSLIGTSKKRVTIIGRQDGKVFVQGELSAGDEVLL